MIHRGITLALGLTFFLVCNLKSFNQEKGYRLDIEIPAEAENKEWISKINNKYYSDSLSVFRAMRSLHERYLNNGYLAAGFNQVKLSDSVFSAIIHSGISYSWGRLELPDSIPDGFPRVPKSVRIKSGETCSLNECNNIREAYARIYENNGYPFVSVGYDSISISDSIIKAKLLIDTGPLVKIDSIISRSETIVSGKVLEQIIGIKRGQPYSEKRIIRAGKQLENSDIIQMSRPLEVGFTEDKAWIYLSPKKKASNSFDGLIGLVPGASNNLGVSLTGSINIGLNNLLKQAETLSIRWKAPGNQNQQLKAGFDIPYFIGWPLGLSSYLDLYRKDSSYLSTDWSFGIQVVLEVQNRLGFYVRQKASNVLLKKPNPLLSDVGINIYGISWDWIQLDNPLNPRKGFLVETNLGVGKKSYGGSDLEGSTNVYWENRTDIDFFIPLSTFFVLNVGANGGYMKGGKVYDNEKFRVGGIYTLRGFDEESILADAFAIGTFEARYLFNRNSNFHVFMDWGKWWSKVSESTTTGNPLGFGVGVSLETRAGIILLDYALGKSENNPLSLRNGKIHLGIKSLF